MADPILAAFPDSYTSPRNVSLKRDIGTGENAYDDADMRLFADKMFKKVHAWLRRTSDRTVQYKSFHLAINYDGKMNTDGGGTIRAWRYLSLGWWDREEFQGPDGLEGLVDRLVHEFTLMGEHYPGSIFIYRFGIHVTGMDWEYRGACAGRTCRVIDNETKITMKQVKSDRGECGPSILLYVMKKLVKSKVIDPTLFINLKSVKNMGQHLAWVHKMTIVKDMLWTPRMLGLVCEAVKVNLVVYHRDALRGDPLYGREGKPSVATIRLAFVPPENPLFGANGEGHYLLIEDLTRRCEKCEEVYDSIGKKIHYCKWTCEHCNETMRIVHTRHVCKEQVKKAIDRIEDEGSEYLTTSRLRMRAEVDDIVEGKVDDSETIAKWRSHVADGHLTCLLGDAGTGKTYAVSSYIKELCESGEMQPNEICVTSAEAVGVTAYRDKLQGLGIDIRTIHSALGLRVGQNWQTRAEEILSCDRNPAIFTRIASYKVLVVDEIGSCAADLFGKLDGMLRIIHANNTPFGGIKVIFTGDFRQRSSSSSIKESREAAPIFMHNTWSALEIKYFTLRVQHRVTNMVDPDEKRFLKIQMYVARGVAVRADLDWLNEKCRVPRTSEDDADPDEVHLMMSNQAVYNKGHTVIQKLYPQSEIRTFTVHHGNKGFPTLPPKFTNALKRRFDEVLMCAIGCPVMFTDNTYIKKKGNPCNGMVGTVVEFGAKDTIMVKLESGDIIGVHRIALPGQGKKSTGIRIYKQFPLRLAYARTIHKTQGVTLKKAAIHLYPTISYSMATSQQAALMYVAISRVRSYKDLWLNRRIKSRDITVCTKSIRFMDMIQTQPYQVVYDTIRKYSTASYSAYAYNMQTVDNYVSVSDKSVSKTKLKMYSREDYATLPDSKKKRAYKGNFHRIIYVDFEAAPKGELRNHVPYYVVARYWENYEVKSELRYGVKKGGGLEPDSLARYTTWMMDEVVAPDVIKWSDSGFKHSCGPIRVVAYNGSNYDFSLIMGWMIENGRWDGLSFQPVHKNSTLIQCTVLHENVLHARVKELLKFWDPCLITMSSMDSCHASMCPEKRANITKDCFPFNWISRVGADFAFAEDKEHELEIEIDFPDKMWGVVKRRITAGSLREGSKAGTVLFNPVNELLTYCDKDVTMLEDVVESLSLTVWNNVFPDANIPVFSYVSAASLGWSATVFHMEDEYKMPTDPECSKKKIRSRLHKLSGFLMEFSRRSNYGGRTLPRALMYVSTMYEELRRKEDEGTLCEQDYLDLEDCLLYIDKVGMYHGIMKNNLFPYEKETFLTVRTDVDEFWRQYLDSRDSGREDFPMFMAEFERVVPNKYDVEAALPGRTKETGKRLLWDNLVKEDCVYNSVHVELGLERGYEFVNPTRILLWGKMSNDVWIANKGKLFAKSSKKWEDFRHEGGAMKTMGKGIANGSFGGSMKKDFHSDIQYYIGDGEDGICPTYDEYVRRLCEPRWKPNCDTTYIRKSDGAAVKMVEWQEQIVEDDYMCSRPGYIGSFILAYAHRDIDNSIEIMIGDKRRDGSTTNQVVNGDTDSIMLHWKHVLNGIRTSALRKEEGKDEELKFDNYELGTFNDDLKKLYRKGSDPILYKEYDGVMMPQFAKIIRQANPGKKLYAMDVLLPTGKIINVDTKKKGIPKGKRLAIINGEERKELIDDELGPVADGAKVTLKRKRAEKEVIEKHLKKMRHTSELGAKYFYDAVEKKSSITARSITMKKRGYKCSPAELSEGIRPYDIREVAMTRQILRKGAAFPPERVQCCRQEDPTLIISVPRGWYSKNADYCICHVEPR